MESRAAGRHSSSTTAAPTPPALPRAQNIRVIRASLYSLLSKVVPAGRLVFCSSRTSWLKVGGGHRQRKILTSLSVEPIHKIFNSYICLCGYESSASKLPQDLQIQPLWVNSRIRICYDAQCTHILVLRQGGSTGSEYPSLDTGW